MAPRASQRLLGLLLGLLKAMSWRHVGGTLLFAASGAQGLHWNLTVWVAPRGAGGFHRLRPSVDGPSKTQWGSMPVLVRDSAP